MKRLGILSDTHGNLSLLKRAVEETGPVDMWLHAGDYIRDARWLATWCPVPVLAVAGNCDRPGDGKAEEFVEIENLLIWLTHGHRQHVKNGRGDLIWWAQQYGAQMAVYGHTHQNENQVQNSVLIFNPGSLEHSRDEAPSWGRVSIENGKVVEAEILHFQGFEPFSIEK